MQNLSLQTPKESRNWDYMDRVEMEQRYSYPQTQSHSRHSSSHSTTADSSPVSLTFSSRGRLSGSTSSLSSTPPHNDQTDSAFATRKAIPALPEVQEDPMERDVFTTRAPYSLSLQNSPVASRRDSRDYSWGRPNSFYGSRDYFDHAEHYSIRDEHFAKRRRSGESNFNSFATRIVERFPSISRKQRSRASTLADDARPERSPPFLSRSSSFRRSLTLRSQENAPSPSEPHLLPSSIETIVEDEQRDLRSSRMGLLYDEEEIIRDSEPLVRSQTPLLLPLMDSMYNIEPIQSPLISPTIAAPSKTPTMMNSPIPTPLVSQPGSPSLSTQRSNSSMARSRATTMVSSASEIPPLVISDTQDNWANKLGHENFYIFPEPYVPEYCDLESCKQLRHDWETACSEFAKHLARTERHFGATSRTYELTKKKWETIEAQWKECSMKAAHRAAASGATPFPVVPIEPAPVLQIPTIDDSRLLSGYDMNIVGPMEQAKPQVQPKESKRAQFMKLFSFATTKVNG